MVLLHVFWLLIVSALGFASPLRAQEPPFPVPDGLEGAVSFWKQIFAQYRDRKSTRLNSSHMSISYAVFCLKKKKIQNNALKEKFGSLFQSVHSASQRIRHTRDIRELLWRLILEVCVERITGIDVALYSIQA